MNIHTLLNDKEFGLYYPEANSYARWTVTMASDASVDIDEGEEDFPVILLFDIKDDDYVPVRADAEVLPADDDEKLHVTLTDIAGVTRFFKVFKILSHDEIFS